MDPYDNNHDIFNPQIGGGPVPPKHVPSEEEKIFRELIGLYQGTLNESGQCSDPFLWESVNKAMDLLIARNYFQYEKFKMEPTHIGSIQFICYPSFRSQLMSALQRMSQDFEFSDPSYLIHAHMPKSGTHINTSATASPTQQNSQSNFQNQNQRQESKLAVEQRVELVEQELNEKLTEEQLSKIRPILEAYKAEPVKWSKASKLIKAVLGLSKDVAVGVISNILSSQMGIPQS
ncbi:MAG TPA: hypothetical protein VMW25_01855 [Clostridia bacterium]|nr:hypothetical protein [Clostridia bacterium]